MLVNPYINQAIDYILAHITEELTVEEVARQCNFSKYHFSRMFKLATGEGIYEFIKRVRMEQSAFRIKAEADKAITDIGARYGYSSSNYSASFRQHHAVSPVQFRRALAEGSVQNPIFDNGDGSLASFADCSAKITIEQVADCRVIYERRIGHYADLSTDWCDFLQRYSDYITSDTILLERTYDDPGITDVNKCLYDICLSAPADCTLPNIGRVEGGRFAVYHFADTAPEIYAAYQSIFLVWLPQSGYQLDDRYGFEIYRKVDGETLYMEIDIYIPIQ